MRLVPECGRTLVVVVIEDLRAIIARAISPWMAHVCELKVSENVGEPVDGSNHS